MQAYKNLFTGSRPLPGVLISLPKVGALKKLAIVFSSPSRGSYISTSKLEMKRIAKKGSRPLPGVLISLLIYRYRI